MGRRLTALSNSTDSITYSYDASGQRVSKTVNGVTTEFYYDDRGVLVLSTSSDGTELRFYADASGNIDSFSYNNEQYYYVRNAQNDVIGITDSTGAFVARYTYDEWGNITAITDGQGNDVSANQSHIANINPLRYRSYFCDVETGLYYVTTRYYDPAIGRFISTDTTDVLTVTPRELTDKNLFAYCDNNPVMRIDYGGQFWESFLDVVSFGASIVEVCINPTDPWAWASLAGDAVDLIPFVTGVGETTRAVKTTVKVVDKSTDVVDAAKTIRKTADATDDIRKATGSYEILYESGKSYIGKGGFDRAITSANRYVKKDDKVVSILWKSAPDPRQAFIDEYLMQRRFGGVLSYNPTLDTYNKIWSPGRGYFGD